MAQIERFIVGKSPRGGMLSRRVFFSSGPGLLFFSELLQPFPDLLFAFLPPPQMDSPFSVCPGEGVFFVSTVGTFPFIFFRMSLSSPLSGCSFFSANRLIGSLPSLTMYFFFFCPQSPLVFFFFPPSLLHSPFSPERARPSFRLLPPLPPPAVFCVRLNNSEYPSPFPLSYPFRWVFFCLAGTFDKFSSLSRSCYLPPLLFCAGALSSAPCLLPNVGVHT